VLLMATLVPRQARFLGSAAAAAGGVRAAIARDLLSLHSAVGARHFILSEYNSAIVVQLAVNAAGIVRCV